MPADLEDLFQALGREADAVPLAGPDHSRRRGRRRGRARAGVSVAAGVVLVMAGFAALRPPDHRTAPVADDTAVPEVGAPIDLGGPVAYAATAHDDDRVYAAVVRYRDNSAWLIAADLHTGAVAWPARPIDDTQRHIDRVVTAPGAVLILTRAANGSRPALGLFAFDPATGAPLWRRNAEEADSLVFSDRALIHVSVAGRRTEAYDWTTGVPRWSVPSDGDRPVRALGITRPADEERVSRAGPAPTVGDTRFVLVTASGQAQVRDVGTGRLQRSLAVPANSGETMVGYGDWLFSHDGPDDAAGPHRIRATDLTGRAGSSVVEELPDRFVTLGGCGPDRLCVVTRHDGDARAVPQTVITAIDVRRREQLWQGNSRFGVDEISSARGRILVTAVDGGYEFYDATGRRVFTSDLAGGWLDAGTLLVIAPDGTGRLARWTVADRRLRPLGDLPLHTVGNCASTGDRLACVTPEALRIWDVG